MQSKPTIDNHREISAALDFLHQASADDGAFDLDPRVVSGWVEMCLGALEVLVTAKRGKHADDKALQQTVEEHLKHARDHAYVAHEASFEDAVDGDTKTNEHIDDDDLPHYNHATARIALLYARKAIVEREKADKPLIKLTVPPVDNNVVTITNRYRADELCGAGSLIAGMFRPAPKTHPNSCKVEKVERGVPVPPPLCYPGPQDWYFYKGTPRSTYDRRPTRPIETDSRPGKAEAKCVTPITHWSVYVDDVKVTDVTDVKCEYGSGVPGMDKIPGFVSETTFGTKPIGIAMNGARRGELVSVAVGGSGTVTFRDPCNGCSYAKWPNKGPGYSERRDKCKLDPNRPRYVSK